MENSTKVVFNFRKATKSCCDPKWAPWIFTDERGVIWDQIFTMIHSPTSKVDMPTTKQLYDC